MDIKRLATHIADLSGWIHMTFTTDEFDFSKPYEQPQINNNADLIAYLEKRYNEGLPTLVPKNEAVLNKPWTLRSGDKIFSTDPKIDIIRMSLSQQYITVHSWVFIYDYSTLLFAAAMDEC